MTWVYAKFPFKTDYRIGYHYSHSVGFVEKSFYVESARWDDWQKIIMQDNFRLLAATA